MLIRTCKTGSFFAHMYLWFLLLTLLYKIIIYLIYNIHYNHYSITSGFIYTVYIFIIDVLFAVSLKYSAIDCVAAMLKISPLTD